MHGASGTDQVLGLFSNTVPIRIRVGDESVGDSIRRTHALLAQLLHHEHAPLELAQRCSAVSAPTPLFSALLNYHHSTELPEPTAETIRAWEGIVSLGGEERTNYPLALTVEDLGEEFALTAQVQSPIDPQRICALMRTAMEQLVRSLESAPTTPLRKMDVLPEAERHQVLVEWNRTKRRDPPDKCIHELFEEQVKRRPEAVAVVFEDKELTYGALNARANQLAHHLISLGVAPQTLVGLYLERSIEMVVGLLGILKAGGAYVPLDPAYPQERLAFILKDTATPVLLTQQALLTQMPHYDGRALCLDRDKAQITAHTQDDPPSRAHVHSLAYVIYTSGSAGRPKGVMIEHQGWANVAEAQRNVFDFIPGTRVLQFASLSFDASCFEISMALANGGTLLLACRDTLMPGPNLVRFLQENRIEVITVPPSALFAVPDAALPDLKVINVASEACPASLVGKWARPPRRFFNLYGPTETTIWSSYAECRPDSNAPPSIGQPINNTQIYILNPDLQLVPIGVPGELYIGGAGVARGYLNLPDLTAEKFLPDPFSTAPGARIYRTGDLARYLHDGNIEYLGRMDHQVKIRGFRIELGEIEAVLGEHGAVRQAVVLAREDTPGDKRLVAYVVPGDASFAGTEPLRAHLRTRLPEFMLPATYVVLDHFPLTPNGKIDRRALPAPALAPYNDLTYAAPVGEIETTLARIWAEVLTVERIGRHDNFFKLGGHSLLAVQVGSRIRQLFSLEIPLRAIFEEPTIAALALLLLEKQFESERDEEMERMLGELEALPEQAVANQLSSGKPISDVCNNAIVRSRTAFHCPHSKSAWFGRRRCNLLIVINESFDWDSFARLATYVSEFDPLVKAVVLRDQADTTPDLPAGPVLTFSPAVLRHSDVARGRAFSGYPLSKSQEYAMLEKARIRVPRWVLLEEGATPDLTGFDKYVVQKPDYGGMGAEVKVVRKSRVRWCPITTRAAGMSSSLIIQELIDTGAQPVSYRVNTLFGKVLYSVRHESSHESLRRLSSNEKNPIREWGSIVASARGSRVDLNFDEEIIRLGEAAAEAFPDIPLLGFDIVREVPSGKLFVLEANAIGYVWQFNSGLVADYGFSLEQQFDGVRKAAYILAEKTQQRAC
jgi:amino acid adenylation domain-containing protein